MTDEQAAMLRHELSSPGWLEIHKPLLVAEKDATDASLGLTQSERPTPGFSDDFLKGYRRGLLFAYQRVERMLREHGGDPVEDLKEPAPSGSPY